MSTPDAYKDWPEDMLRLAIESGIEETPVLSWIESGFGVLSLHRQDGLIVGQVTFGMGLNQFSAYFGTELIGTYISQDTAKAAVERAAR